MGLQDNIFFSGNDGVMVYYVVNGKGRTRSMAAEVRQSAATREAARHFGRAVKLSAAIRKGLAPLLQPLKGRQLINRVNRVCNRWIHASLQAIPAPEGQQPYWHGFQFNPHSSLEDRLKVPLRLDWPAPGRALLNIPMLYPLQDINAPAGTVAVQVRAGITSCHTSTGWHISSYTTAFDIPYNSEVFPARQLQLPYTGDAGSITLAAMALAYIPANGKKLYDKRLAAWEPVGVAGAITL